MPYQNFLKNWNTSEKKHGFIHTNLLKIGNFQQNFKACELSFKKSL